MSHVHAPAAAAAKTAEPSNGLARLAPWLLLAAGLAWTAALRIPLVIQAPAHLDSDLAVDGLTLRDTLQGRWRWHYPGTPHMGIAPMFLSLPQALAAGLGPETLVSGGVVAWALAVVAIFLLCRRAYGVGVACGALVPLVFSSSGVLWLSGRITGGHLLTLAWFAAALAGLHGCLVLGGRGRVWCLGLWCGLGLWVDAMFLFALCGIASAGALAWWLGGRDRGGLRLAAIFAAGLAVGIIPRVIGQAVDPYDAYGSQFQPIFQADVLYEHSRILLAECLPRLIVGHVLPEGRMALGVAGRLGAPDPLDWPLTVAGLALFALALLALLARTARPRDVPQGAVGAAVAVACTLVLAGFVVNRNIFNSDNYRYLVFLLVPWSIGFGLLVDGLRRRGPVGRLAVVALVLGWAGVATFDLYRWHGQMRWVGGDGRPAPVRAARLKLPATTPPVTHIFGDYWLAYREAFGIGGGLMGVPTPFYPDRFPGWSRDLGPGRGTILVASDRVDWPALLRASWRRDGGDPAALEGVNIVPLRDPRLRLDAGASR